MVPRINEQPVVIRGNLGADPEAFETPAGKEGVRFSVATWAGRSKDDQVQSAWVRVTVWAELAKRVLTGLHKGDGVVVGGMLNPEPFVSEKDGSTRAFYNLTGFSVGRSTRGVEILIADSK